MLIHISQWIALMHARLANAVLDIFTANRKLLEERNEAVIN